MKAGSEGQQEVVAGVNGQSVSSRVWWEAAAGVDGLAVGSSGWWEVASAVCGLTAGSRGWQKAVAGVGGLAAGSEVHREAAASVDGRFLLFLLFFSFLVSSMLASYSTAVARPSYGKSDCYYDTLA